MAGGAPWLRGGVPMKNYTHLFKVTLTVTPIVPGQLPGHSRGTGLQPGHPAGPTPPWPATVPPVSPSPMLQPAGEMLLVALNSCTCYGESLKLLHIIFSERSDNGGSGQTTCWFIPCHQIFTALQRSRFKPSIISRMSEIGRTYLGLLNVCL